jgi:hypothetical protein
MSGLRERMGRWLHDHDPRHSPDNGGKYCGAHCMTTFGRAADDLIREARILDADPATADAPADTPLRGLRRDPRLAALPGIQPGRALSQRNAGKEYPDLLAADARHCSSRRAAVGHRERARRPDAPRLRICGCQVGLELRRVRWFETSWGGFDLDPPLPPPGPVVSVVGHGTPSWVREQLGYNPTIADYRAAMGIDWMNRNELSQAIPPAYTRCGMVTASVVGTLLTPKLEVADNETSRRLTAQLVAERITGRVEPTFTSDDMFRGIEAEGYVRDLYSEHYHPVQECGFVVRTEGDWELGWSPDGLVGDDGCIEIKAPRAKGHLATILDGRVPRAHMAQCQAALLVSGREWLEFLSFHGGMPLWPFRVLPDPEWQEAIVAAVQKFEENAAEMTAAYEAATAGLPMTERLDMEMHV